jgi:hypothetical protein
MMDWVSVLNQIFELCIIPLSVVLTGVLVATIHWKKNQLVKETDNDIAKQYIEMLDKTIVDCVIATNQTYVETLKKEGNFTGDAHKVAFQKTFDAVMDILSEEAKKYLEVSINNLENYITNKIESTVHYVKK